MALPSPPKEPAVAPAVHARRRRQLGNLFGNLALVLLLVAFVAGGAWALSALRGPPDRKAQPPPFLVPLQDVAPGTAVPGNAQAVPAPQATATEESLDTWARRVSGKTDIPVRALRAYAVADLAMQSQAPACRVSWATLAGIGRVESHHGVISGSRLGEDGRATKPIIGVPLDGSPGVKAIKDTDGGRLDGDVTWDRAVGPMQFIPGTWLRYATRASGDGNPPDPQNVDDAALTAARYLCADGRDLGTGSGWWGAVKSYNDSVRYGQQVFSGADAYARASLT